MKSLETTNWLLLSITLLLLVHLGLRMVATPAWAETFKLDSCITADSSEKPLSYLHVITHRHTGS